MDEMIHNETEDHTDQDLSDSHTEILEKLDSECIDPVDDLQDKLDNVTFLPQDWPPEKVFRTLFDTFEEQDYPKSYRSNTLAEEKVMNFVESFRVQYHYLYPDRKTLLLSPVNDCEIPKFVCTTIRRTKLPHREVYNWDGAADFVSNFLNYVPLIPSTELPKRLLSPMTVLRIQRGTCFDYANLLLSLLIGVGYNAYVVSGYGTREVCYMDQKLDNCPFLKPEIEEPEKDIMKPMKKYSIKPAREYLSKFEINLESTKIKTNRDAKIKDENDRMERLREAEKPLPDKLYGLRVHAWILVREGKRDIKEGFFIEPSTGVRHSLKEQMVYNGLESIWNHENYWVNMQDCTDGIDDIQYDVTNSLFWEQIIPEPYNPETATVDPVSISPGNSHDSKYNSNFENDEEIEEAERRFKLREEHDKASIQPELPPSWTQLIKIDRARFETRFPLSSKITCFNRVVLERFAPYFLLDGLVTRIRVYSDKACTDHLKTTEHFLNRTDKLTRKEIDIKTGWITEFFDPGRTYALREHTYQMAAPGPENRRIMLFRDAVRVDGLVKREETPTMMTETYIGRPDRLLYRYTMFEPRKFNQWSATTPDIEVDDAEETSDYLPDKPGSGDSVVNVRIINSDISSSGAPGDKHDLNVTLQEESLMTDGKSHMSQTSHSTMLRSTASKKKKTSLTLVTTQETSRADNFDTHKNLTESAFGENTPLNSGYTNVNKEGSRAGGASSPMRGKESILLQRKIESIVERFDRNPELPADEDVAERAFQISKNRMKLTYHKHNKTSSSSTREFLKPQQMEDQMNRMTLQDETHTNFMVDQYKKDKSRERIFQTLLDLYNLETEAMDSVRWGENETWNIVNQTLNCSEHAANQLDISKFDSLRNEAAKFQRMEREKMLIEEQQRYQELSLDYLSPFLAQIGFLTKLSWDLACKLREDCLNDFKKRLINKANLIQNRLTNETRSLQHKQQWYMENRVTMSEEDEERYVEYCNNAAFLITTLQLMLSRHKLRAPYRYIELETRIKQDPRLAILNCRDAIY